MGVGDNRIGKVSGSYPQSRENSLHAWPYFFLKDTRDHTVVTVAKRLFVLDQSLHFPDLGGCCAANAPHFLKSELA